MKILFINTVCGKGSTGTIVTKLMSELKKCNHDSKIVFGVGTPKLVSKDEYFRTVSKLGYYTHVALSRITDHTGLYSTLCTKRVIKKIKNYDPDIIHIHNLHGYYINYKLLFEYLKSSGVGVVWTLHDCWAFTGHCAYFDAVGCDKWKTHCDSCPIPRSYPKCITKGNAKSNYDIKKTTFTSVDNMVIVTPSKWLGDLCNQSFLGKYDIRVINNGVDTNVFKYSKSDFRRTHKLENKKIVLAVANVWTKNKGYDDIIQLASLLGDKYKVVIVGLSDKQIKDLPANIIGIRHTYDRHKLAQLYSMADVFVNTTYEDNYPTVNLEAQACGTHVVTYNIGGCPETIGEGKGTVVEANNIEALKSAVETECCTSKNTSSHNTNNGRLSDTLMCKQYFALYDEIL